MIPQFVNVENRPDPSPSKYFLTDFVQFTVTLMVPKNIETHKPADFQVFTTNEFTVNINTVVFEKLVQVPFSKTCLQLSNVIMNQTLLTGSTYELSITPKLESR